jgi:hypothetical protein
VLIACQDKESVAGFDCEFILTVVAYRFTVHDKYFVLHILMRVHRDSAARLDLEQPHRIVRRAVLLRDQPAQGRAFGAGKARSFSRNILGVYDLQRVSPGYSR